MAAHLCGPLLTFVYGWVFSVNVVAYLGLGHGPAHLVGGFGYRIATQVDQCHL